MVAGCNFEERTMTDKVTSTASTGKPKQKVKPAEPLHYKFLTEVALDIHDAAQENGASQKGILFVIAHAALESGWAADALKAGDYNLFGMMTLSNDFIRKTTHGKVKDYSNAGGFKASMDDYFNRISDHGWSGLDLIKKTVFAPDDIDKAFNTGKYSPTLKERHAGKYTYNADIDPNDGKNHYGNTLYIQMRSVKKRIVEAIDFRILEIQQDGARPEDQKQIELQRYFRVRNTMQGVVL
jgi:hypothetical protein